MKSSPPPSQVVRPDWPAPPGVRAFTTTRAGGVSTGSFASLNLGAAGADDPAAVAENRRRFRAWLPSEPGWLRQVHGREVLHRVAPGDGDGGPSGPGTLPEADAAWTRAPGLACMVLTADCLPVLFCDQEGGMVAVAHAGWRGLAAGVLQATIAALPAPPERLLAWIGPGIGVGAYEVGDDFRATFLRRLPWLERDATGAFERRGGRTHANLEAVARAILRRAGIGGVHGGGYCTYTDRERFFSHRRNPDSGRMATVIWREEDRRG